MKDFNENEVREEIRKEVEKEVQAYYDKAFRKALIILFVAWCILFNLTCWGAPAPSAQKQVQTSAKVIDLRAPKAPKAKHDSITGAYVRTEKGTFAVFRGPKGGLYYWQAGKKHYLPKKFKSQISGKK